METSVLIKGFGWLREQSLSQTLTGMLPIFFLLWLNISILKALFHGRWMKDLKFEFYKQEPRGPNLLISFNAAYHNRLKCQIWGRKRKLPTNSNTWYESRFNDVSIYSFCTLEALWSFPGTIVRVRHQSCHIFKNEVFLNQTKCSSKTRIWRNLDENNINYKMSWYTAHITSQSCMDDWAEKRRREWKFKGGIWVACHRTISERYPALVWLTFSAVLNLDAG